MPLRVLAGIFCTKPKKLVPIPNSVISSMSQGSKVFRRPIQAWPTVVGTARHPECNDVISLAIFDKNVAPVEVPVLKF